MNVTRARALAYIAIVLALAHAAGAQTGGAFRPPAVPLIACDPYFSVWSPADRLTDRATVHWTGARQSLISLIRIDGKCYRLMGDEPNGVPAMEQESVRVLPTRSVYRFQSAEVGVTLTFMNADLPDDLDALSRPLTYISWSVRSVDGRRHDASLFLSASAELTVNSTDQRVVWRRVKAGSMTALRIGSEDQPVLERAGDGVRIDWGYAYLASPSASTTSIASARSALSAFVVSGGLPSDDTRMPREARDDMPTMAIVIHLGKVDANPVSRFAMLAYDDVYSINYFGRNLRGYWRRNGMDAPGLLQAAARDYARLDSRCGDLDSRLMADLTRIGGPKYAQICALAYRQCLAACKLCADSRGMPMLFPKENTSNGCISTVDVIYPMDPMYLLISPMLAKASLAPVLNYTASPLWRFRYAPHDLGTYPHATRQVYAGDDDPAHEGDRMPVEESGNMILLLAAIAKAEGTPEFAGRYWPQVTEWARYLEEKGFDPENQLCTDDFTGHLAHNANLSVKAIEALGAYGLLCEMRGDKAGSSKYRNLARAMAAKWTLAAEDGDHYRLAFDRPGTWSQKYNMIWDRILGLDLFPPQVLRKEMAFYLRTRDEYGLALDNRQPYAKTDWSIWTASMAPNEEKFRALADPIYDFLNHTPERNPMTDLYWTKKGSEVGMHARPVVGGVFIRMLTDPPTWRKWLSRAASNPSAAWAPIPKPPVESVVVPTAEKEPIVWRYTTERPADSWYTRGFADSSWQEAPGPFGTAGTPGISPRTEWKTSDVWLRREFTMPSGGFPNLQLRLYHDEDVEVYIDGALASRASGFVTSYALIPLRPGVAAALKPGKHLMAVHCHQTAGGQGIDVGISSTTDH